MLKLSGRVARLVLGCTVAFGVAVVGNPGVPSGASTGATPIWVQVQPAHHPFGPGQMAYDPELSKIVFFGDDGTWVWNGVDWSQPTLSSAPPSRYGMVTYDPALHAVVLYGGIDGYGTVYHDTWTYTAAGWTALSGQSPPPVAAGAIAYDPVSASVVLVGGWSCSVSGDPGCLMQGTWLLHGTTWHQAQVTHELGRVAWPALGLDPSSNRLVLLDGSTCSDTSCTTSPAAWRWTGSDWAAQDTPSIACAYATMATDGLTGELVVDGYCDGSPGFGPEVATDGVHFDKSGSAAAMPTFELPAMAYDAATGQFLVQDGFGRYATWSSQLLVPQPPRAPVAIARAGAIDVSWTAPVDSGNAPVERYVATLSGSSASCTTTGSIATAPPTSCTIPAGPPRSGPPPTVTVIAANPDGSSAAAVAKVQISPVRSIEVQPRAHSLEVSWAAPASPAAPIADTVVVARLGNGRVLASCTATASARRCLLTGLPDLVPLSVTVTVVERQGHSGPPLSGAATVDDVRAAQSLQVAASGLWASTSPGGVVTAGWRPAVGGDGEPVTYQVWLGKPGSPPTELCRTTGTSCAGHLPGPPERLGTTFTLRVLAVTPAALAHLVVAPLSAPLTVRLR